MRNVALILGAAGLFQAANLPAELAAPRAVACDRYGISLPPDAAWDALDTVITVQRL